MKGTQPKQAPNFFPRFPKLALLMLLFSLPMTRYKRLRIRLSQCWPTASTRFFVEVWSGADSLLGRFDVAFCAPLSSRPCAQESLEAKQKLAAKVLKQSEGRSSTRFQASTEAISQEVGSIARRRYTIVQSMTFICSLVSRLVPVDTAVWAL